jgi:hypothetical protein
MQDKVDTQAQGAATQLQPGAAGADQQAGTPQVKIAAAPALDPHVEMGLSIALMLESGNVSFLKFRNTSIDKTPVISGHGVYSLESGTAIARAGAVVIAQPGTKVRAEDGSIVLLYRGAEAEAIGNAIVIKMRVRLQPAFGELEYSGSNSSFNPVPKPNKPASSSWFKQV